MNKDFQFVMEGEKLDALSMEDIKGGISSEEPECCGTNSGCNKNNDGPSKPIQTCPPNGILV